MVFVFDVITSALITFVIGCSIMFLYLKLTGFKKTNLIYNESMNILKGGRK